ncbi:Hypothetical protein MexAM1_META1p1126 [Methylorubrum extorquens AM1]|uniref:Uncharacterized protein n=1 Tax=Methylorubrum extorquens (strain ATCC 14718 / DSM 1338 / JCM 2805 / NCIMB 9133 / AM1) TaxID=272630 RepID=C5AXU5_METEA|nr:Hypothetical protein MexAM1_META1p1126 [Methylorubrum extorquens AM1]
MSINRLDPNIRRQGVVGGESVDSSAPLSQVGRSRMGSEANPDHVNVARRHVSLPA